MARNDGVDRVTARNVNLADGKIANVQRHNEREKESYVCCSRPKKRLIMFVTIPIDSTFRTFLQTLVGVENIYTYTEFIQIYENSKNKNIE